MINIYETMLTTHALEQGLLQLGFTQQANKLYFSNGDLQVQLLDAPRLRVHSAGGVSYIAVLSLPHLAQQLAAL